MHFFQSVKYVYRYKYDNKKSNTNTAHQIQMHFEAETKLRPFAEDIFKLI